MNNTVFKIVRFIARVYLHTFYRFKSLDAKKIPAVGSAILVSNHITFLDWLFIIAHSPRPLTFVMHYRFTQIPLLGSLISKCGIIPICSRKECPIILDETFKQIRAKLLAGDMICLFPEGRLTRDGKLGVFKPGIEKILRETPVPVIPLTLTGLWGSFLSCSGKGAFTGFLTRLRPQVTITSFDAFEPNLTSAKSLQTYFQEMGV